MPQIGTHPNNYLVRTVRTVRMPDTDGILKDSCFCRTLEEYGLISWHKECNRRTTFVAEHWRFDEPRKVTKTWSIRRGPIKAIHLGASLLEQGVAKARLRRWKLNKFEHHFIPSGWNLILRCPSWNRMESLQGIFVAKRVPTHTMRCKRKRWKSHKG